MSRRCVLLFARSPELEGRAKGLRAESALFALARRRVAAAVAALPGVALVLAGGGDVPAGARGIRQRGRAFGERLENALADVRALGFEHVLAVPCDVPSIAATHLAEAFAALDEGATPLGPSPDGGVYLIGLDTTRPAPLAGMRWQTPRVLADLLAAIARDGGRARLLPALSDVDERRDLLALAAERADPELRRLVQRLLARASVRAVPVRVAALLPRRSASASRAPPPAPSA